jgi:hypothetical protein
MKFSAATTRADKYFILTAGNHLAERRAPEHYLKPRQIGQVLPRPNRASPLFSCLPIIFADPKSRPTPSKSTQILSEK